MVDPYQNLASLGLSLPAMQRPIANYVSHVRDGDLLYISGQAPRTGDGHLHVGKVGDDVAREEAYAHARITGLNLLAVMEDALGDLRRVRRILKIVGMVNATPDFTDHPFVINGCSDLLVEVFGDIGKHARSAIGQGSLPNRMTVEIEAIVAIHA